MSLLPIFQTKIQELLLMQNKWSSLINSLLDNASLQSEILSDVKLTSGLNVINHRLGRKLIGWRIIRIDGASAIYDRQIKNQTPTLTLLLMSSIPVNVSLEVF